MKKYIIFSLLLLGLYTFSACYPITTLPQTDENQSVSDFNTENTQDLTKDITENAASNSGEEHKTPMAVRIDGVIYTSDGETSDIPRCGIMDGYIDSCVDSNSLPDKDRQSNFGADFGFQYGPDGTIHVLIDGNWTVFYNTENTSETDSNSETVMFDGKVYEKDTLSASTLEWLEGYNSLSLGEQQLIEYIPEELIF